MSEGKDPFTLDLEELKELQNDAKDGSPLPALLKLQELVEQARDDESQIPSYFMSGTLPEFINDFLGYFYETDDDAAVAASLFQDVISLIAKKIKEGNAPEDLLKLLPKILDCERPIYKYFGFSDEDQAQDESGATPAWREAVGFSDWIDALSPGDSKGGGGQWTRAQVVGEDPDTNTLHLSFEGAGAAAAGGGAGGGGGGGGGGGEDLWVDRATAAIAPLGARTGADANWRAGLAAGDLVDCQDDRQVWYNSTVLEVRQPEAAAAEARAALADADPAAAERAAALAMLRGPEAKVAFRVYDPEGEKEDDEGRKFFGWSKTYDEWIPSKSPRLARVNSRVKEKNSHVLTPLVEDAGDPGEEEGGGELYALARPGVGGLPGLGSAHLAGAAQRFLAETGGLAAALADDLAGVPLPGVVALAQAAAKVRRLLTRSAAAALLPRVWAAAAARLTRPRAEAELRAFGKEQLEAALAALKLALKRVWPGRKCCAAAEALVADLALTFLGAGLMERQLQSLKLVKEQLIGNATRFQNALFDKKKVVAWLNESEYLLKVFKGHTQLVQRTDEILLFLCREKEFTQEHLDALWAAGQGQGEDRAISVFKVVQKLLFYFEAPLFDRLVAAVLGAPAAELPAAAVDLLKEVARAAGRFPDAMLRALDGLWELTREEGGGGPRPAKLRRKAEEQLVEAYRLYNLKAHRTAALVRAVGNISAGQSVMMSLRIIRQVLNLLPTTAGAAASTAVVAAVGGGQETPLVTKQQAIEALQAEHDVLGVLVRELEAYAAAAAAAFAARRAREPQLREQDLDNMVVTGLEPHIPQVRARLELLDHLLQAAPGLALPLGPARRLWDALFAPGGATAHQRREIMGWFRRAAEGQANGRVCFEAGVAEALLTDVVVPAALPPPTAAAAAPAAAAAGAAPPGGAVGGEEAKEEGEAAAAAAPGAAQLDAPQPGADPEHKIPKELESEAFELFKSFFLLVNLQAGKLVPAAAGAAGSALGGLACAVGPAGLAGHADLWRAALGARSAGAARAAVGLLDRLHRALAPGLDAPEIARAYLAECMGRLGAAVAAGAAAGAGPAGAAAAARALEALELLVDEGGGGGGRAARAHAARARGKKARLSVANDLGEDSVAQIGEAIELEVYTSLTVWELRRRLGRAASLAPDKVKLTQGGRVLDDKVNGRTLGELGVRSGGGGGGGGGGGWKLGRRQAPEPAKVDLIGKDNRLVPACIAIFTEWFYLWAPDGLMNREGAAAFIKACTGQIVQPYDPQISHFMATYDEDNDDKLTLKEFLLLYQDTAKIMPHVVWNNLKAMGYRNDLRKEDDDLGGGDHGPAGEGGGGAHAAEADGQPRALLSRSEAYFAQLLGVCARLPGTEAAARAWALLMRLPTHPEALRDLRSLDKVKNPEPDWNLLLDSNSVYRLLYSLQIIESFVEPPVDEGGVELLVSAPSSRTTSAVAAEAPAADGKRREEEAQAKREERLAWRRRFLLYGGFQHLYGVLMAGVGGEEGDAAAAGGGRGAAAGAGVRRKCLALTLKVVGTFLLEALAVDNPEALNAAKLVRAQSRSSRPMVPSSSSSEPLPLPPPPPPAHNLDALPPLPGQGGFLDLDRKLSSKLQARLTDAVDFPALQARVVSLAREAAAAANEAADSGAEDEGSADELAEAALGLWVGTVLAQPHLLQTFFHVMADDVEGFTFDTLFCKSKMIRREAAHSLRGATGAVGGGGGGGGAARELGRGWYGAAQGPGGLTVPRARFLALLLAELPRVGGGGGGRAECDQYFDLLTALVSDTIEATENAGDDSENNWGVRLVDGTFVNELVQRLLDHPTTEKRGSNKEDKLLVGLMKLIVVIISKVGALRGPVGARLVGPLFAEFLFAPPAPRGGGGDNGGGGGNGGGRRAGGEGGEGGAAAEAPPKCKTQASRAAAYELLAAVCRGSRANLERVLADGLAPLLARVDRLARWDYRPSGQERASSGFVGMRNLGNVCYLNSTMQQLFLNEKFRNAIFSCEDPADAKEESVLTQLQLLFGHLQLSERQAANPRGLCNSIKDWDGMPIDVSIQQDAQSFLLQFRDKLEEAMKGTPQEDAFKRAYCGQLVNQLIYKGEVRERLEEFTCISLEVKNMKGVADAFDKFISKDTIEGFSWEEKGPGVDVQKRAVLGTLPPSVILHLNRFTMNMDTFMTEKLNTRFEFPMRLNLEPYTKEGVERREAAQAAEGGAAAIEGGEEGAAPPAPGDNGNVAYSLHPREYYEYELVGVQVHYGTANQGHYYSFARDRKGGGGGDGDGQGKPKWYEFNDSLVRSWNISNLELDCFGGSSASQWTTKDRISNAYLLFYDRVKPKLALPATPALPAAGAGEGAGEEGAGGAPPAAAAGTPPAPSTAVQASVGAVRAAAKFKGNLKKAVSKRGQSDGTVPENVFQEVWHDNDKFSFDRQVYHHDFFKFVSSFLDSTKTSLEGDGKELTEFGKSCVKFGTSFLFDVVAHAYDNDSLKDSVETLTTFFKWAPEEAAKYLDNVAIKGDMEEARELLLECKDKHVRAQYRGFLAALLAALGPAEAPRYLDAEDAPPPPSEGGGGAAAGGEEAAPRRRPATATARFLDGLLALLPGAAKEWARIEQFAQVFEVMANLGPEAREMMLARRVLAHLLDFFLRDKSPFVREGEKRTAMGNKMYSPRLGPLVRAAAALVQHALAAPAAAPGGGATTGRPAAEALGEAERLCLESEAFYELALEEDQDPRAVGRVLCAVFRGDELAAARFSRFILKGLDDATYEGVRPYMALMREWLALDDGLQPLRIELVMGRPLEKDDGGLLKSMWDNRLRYERWLYKILFSLADMLLEIEPLGAYVAAIGEQDAAGPQAGGGGAAAGSAPAQDRYCEWLLKFAARTFMGLNRPGWVDTQECAAVGDKLARWERRHHGASGLERQRLAAARQGGAAELDCNASSGVVVSVVEHYPPKEEGQDERKGEEEANALVWKVKNNRLEKIRFTLTMEVAEGDDPNYVLPNGPVVLEVEAQSSAEVYRARRAAPGGGGWRLARYRWAFELAEGVAAPDIGEADPVAAMQRRQRQAQRAAAGGGGGAAATGGVASYAVAVGTGGDDMMMYDSLMDDGYAADVVWDDMD